MGLVNSKVTPIIGLSTKYNWWLKQETTHDRLALDSVLRVNVKFLWWKIRQFSAKSYINI